MGIVLGPEALALVVLRPEAFDDAQPPDALFEHGDERAQPLLHRPRLMFERPPDAAHH